MKVEAWINHGKAGEPMRTESLEIKEDLLPHHEMGLSYTRTGYGSKIPSRFKVKMPGNPRWYRVYSMCFGNASSDYVIIGGESIFVNVHIQ